MAKVIAKPGEDFSSLLRRFKQQVKRDEIMYEVKKREHFLPEALKRKEKSLHAKLKSKPKHKR